VALFYRRVRARLPAQISGLVFAADQRFPRQLDSALKQYLKSGDRQLAMQSPPLLLAWGTGLPEEDRGLSVA
jgi:hypothetical protein